jgi:uncharacterized protein DUF4410
MSHLDRPDLRRLGRSLYARTLVIALAAALLGGCASWRPEALWLDRDTFNDKEGLHLRRWTADTMTSATAPDVLLCEGVVPGHGLLVTTQTAVWLGEMDRNIQARLLTSPDRRASIVLRDRSDLPRYRTLGRTIHRIDLTVTRLEAGPGLLRYLVGWGAGEVKLQVEGRVTDDASGAVLSEFVVREDYWGEAWFGLNPRTMGRNYSVRRGIRRQLAPGVIAALVGFI